MGNCHNIAFRNTHQSTMPVLELPPQYSAYDTLPYFVPSIKPIGRIINIISANTFIVAAYTTQGSRVYQFKITLPNIYVPDIHSSDTFEKDLATKCLVRLKNKYMNQIVILHDICAHDHDGYASSLRMQKEVEPTISQWLILNKWAIPSLKHTTAFSWKTYYHRRPRLSPIITDE